MTETATNQKLWTEIVASFKNEVGNNIPCREELERFSIQAGWFNGQAADFHEEGHLTRVLVGVNVLYVLLAVRGKLPKILEHRDWKDAISAAAIGHDVELTNNLKEYKEHGLLAMNKLPEILKGVISPNAMDLARLLCYWHVPEDNELSQDIDSWFRVALWMIKDIDGAERIRLPEDYCDKTVLFDASFLRFEETKELLPIIKELINRTTDIDEANPEIGFKKVLDQAVEMGVLR